MICDACKRGDHYACSLSTRCECECDGTTDDPRWAGHDIPRLVYSCPRCGDVTDVEPVEMIDTDRDEVWTEMLCHCGASVRPKQTSSV